MSALFDTLMVVSLGLLGGACFGLLIGYGLRLQAPAWGLMTTRQKLLNLCLVAVCSAFCIGVIAAYVYGFFPKW